MIQFLKATNVWRIATLLLLFQSYAQAQTVVNAYFKVTAIDATRTKLTISDIHQSKPGGFTVLSTCILMQMQDNVLGNLTNSASFGSLGATLNAGISEEVEVATVKGSPINEVTLKKPLNNTFNINNNSSVQLMSFTQTTSFATTSVLTALPWDGHIGGVLALNDAVSITLRHNLTVSGAGFRGGAVNSNQTTTPSSVCDPSIYISARANVPLKGEGIFTSTTTWYQRGRAKVINGGGSGSHHNGGGGGGGNYTKGGRGGPGWNNTVSGCSPEAGGQGGIDLSAQISHERFFMGGGGGGGQGNNSASTAGGNGGGIVIIKAPRVVVAKCVTISANGSSADTAGNDGAGGGGSGGTITLDVDSWQFNCELVLAAKGGNGGGSNYGITVGGGGGGGKGVVMFLHTPPSLNNPAAKDVTTRIAAGTGGANAKNGIGGTAASGSDVPSNGNTSTGVLDLKETILPVTLLYWRAAPERGHVRLSWGTATESNNDHFTLHRSADGVQWQELAILEGHGTTLATMHYQFMDKEPLASTNYYRLSQTDYDGTTEIFDVISAQPELTALDWRVYPNPTSGLVHIVLPSSAEGEAPTVTIMNMAGRQVLPPLKVVVNKVTADMYGLPEGIYAIKVAWRGSVKTFKVQLRR